MFLLQLFELNTNLLETNLFNILILIGLILYVAKGFFTSTVETRRSQIIKSLDNLDKNLVSANQRFLESNKQLKQIDLLIESLQKENNEQKYRSLDNKYNILVKNTNRLFDLSQLTIENTAQDTFVFLQKYLVTLVIGMLLIKFCKCGTTQIDNMKVDQQALLLLCVEEVVYS